MLGKCDRHGDLTEDNTYQSIENSRVRIRCKECVHESRVTRYATTREKSILAATKWKKENRERVNKLVAQDKIDHPEKYAKWRKNYYERNKVDINTRSICRYHGLDIPTYESMFEAQGHKCAICDKMETRKMKGVIMRLCVDHDHKTGRIRGLLCHDCNSGLGKFHDSSDLLTLAAMYIMESE